MIGDLPRERPIQVPALVPLELAEDLNLITEPFNAVPRPGLSLDAWTVLTAMLLVASVALGYMPHVPW